MIKMIAGVFGLNVNGIVKAMDKTSDPFNAGKEQEERLVKLGLAKYVDEPAEKLPEGATGVLVYSEEMSAKELREIGKRCGLTFKVGMSKAEMVAELDAYTAEHTGEGEEVNEEDEIATEDDAPTFDAAEAVQ